VLSSPDNRRDFAGWGQSSFVQSLLARIDANPGGIVPLTTESPPSIRPASVARGPARVAILMDRNVVSAGETFVLEAMRSPKVTLYGDNTGGVIDYANVSILSLACADRGLGLGYPLMASSRELPRGAVNNVGIPPDVRIRRDVSDPIQWVVQQVRR
jgi:C-terminal processing protease CtpA/Prc